MTATMEIAVPTTSEPHVGCEMPERIGSTCEDAGRELEAIAAMQRLLLPAYLPELPGIDLSVFYRPARLSGGDYYDFLPLDGGRVGIFIADVSGHGAAAAMVVAILHATIRGFANVGAPAELLAYVNRRLATDHPAWQGQFVTAFYGILDPAAGTLTYSNAGHPLPRVASTTQPVRAVEGGHGIPLGIDPSAPYELAEIGLAAGDSLVLYTDGLIEARNALGDWFGLQRLDAALHASGADASTTTSGARRDLQAFSGNGAPADDQTLLVARLS